MSGPAWATRSVTLLACVALAVLPSSARDDRTEIERVLRARVGDVLAQKDPSGRASQRASYSRDLRRVDDDTRETGFLIDTATDDTLTTRRYRLVLRREGNGDRWRIDSSRLEDTWEALTRSVPGTEEFDRFDAVRFEGEGLVVHGGPGFLYTVRRSGSVRRIVLTAAELAYEYSPPGDTDRLRHALFLERHERDVSFEPDLLSLSCDPTTCAAFLASNVTNPRPVTSGEADPVLRRHHDEYVHDLEADRRRDWFDGFLPPTQDDRRYWTAAIRRASSEHRIALRYDSYAPREVSFFVDDYGRLYLYNAEDTARLPAKDRDRRPDPELRDLDLTSVRGTVELGYGDLEGLRADLTYELRARRPLQAVDFDLAAFSPDRKGVSESKHPRLQVDLLQDGEGNDLTWVKTGPASGRVKLAREVAGGETITLKVGMENRDCVYKFTPHYFYVARSGWLPFVQYGDPIDQLDLTLKVPSRFTALGVGQLVEETKEGSLQVTRWVSRNPVHFPTIAFGSYETAASELKVKRGDGVVIPVTAHIDVDHRTSVGPRGLESIAQQAALALELYQRLFEVDYPFGKLDLVNDTGVWLGAQSPDSMIFYGSAWGSSKGVGQMTKAEQERAGRSLIPHEVAHQWWGAVVPAAGETHDWIIEAAAEFTAALYSQAARGLEAYLTAVEDWRREIIGLELPVSVQDASLVTAGGPTEADVWHALRYAKGPYLFHMMRSIWGDAKLVTLFRAVMRQEASAGITTADLEALAAATFRQPVGWLFDQWVRGIGIPEFTFTYRVVKGEGDKYTIEGDVRQRVLLNARLAAKKPLDVAPFRCIVYVTAKGRSGREYQWKLDVRQETTSFNLAVDEKPFDVELNRDGETLAHDVLVRQGGSK